ncbi:MAG: hypothetical protein A3I89_03810 [Candidatus Harrisonbacteria bacterium RIFCSPLOWO2_02_FULL_41_11]|uniref:DUF4129 domain-containing protein n=1 Tax=Candidatus Harrisonbacteria bacterium RIFCSPHIGHO2_02_FULL_42_16 TaxID=1798404 RepID=A0A1G1ZFW7_9BACT|nr:MAG: hypothetical protein A3B92_01525 [Candidatus Harrisonbacteria bacterium RIFCSPHIGHO2_02_FULL_42_16]OGY66187.1 MAG: hypothetical protein A3I89_03810 [Candidatus Harrisonbacteria bacterium RIFCSPLOWO2_02_FULL_41_11]
MDNVVLKTLYDARDFFGGYLAPNLWWLQIVSLIFSALFIWGIIYIVNKANYFGIKREQYLDTLGMGHTYRHRTLMAWKQIQKMLASNEAGNWKKAILDSDLILNEILKMSGYLGREMEDKLEFLTAAQLPNLEEIKIAHEIRDKIVNDPSFEITQDEAREVVGRYERSFKELNLIQE